MSLLEKITDLISQVNNEEDKTDKRKLIDEVAGMMKSAGCDDEVIRTAIGKMEKIGYDESEAKNAEDEIEEEELEEEEEVANKKCKNEDDEEKEEDKKEDKEEDEAENKRCKNSMDDDIKKVIMGGSAKVQESGYVSMAKRLEMGNKY
ncbi:MAG: hypothetical protein II453_10000 [Alphaproteobacteria bacterium]|nr:hypothetical protein [Alphaproteobacteria bacterium]MBQ3946347.1 hypothetical protein [Alphaproteobacteria bacterium]